MLPSISLSVFCFCLLAPMASADTAAPINRFYGAEMILTPIATKWACGELPDEDLRSLDALMAAFPEDAREAELQTIIAIFLEASKRETGLSEIIGSEFSDEQEKRLCAVATPLSLDWLTPEVLSNVVMTDEEDVMSTEQFAAWDALFKFIEGPD